MICLKFDHWSDQAFEFLLLAHITVIDTWLACKEKKTGWRILFGSGTLFWITFGSLFANVYIYVVRCFIYLAILQTKRLVKLCAFGCCAFFSWLRCCCSRNTLPLHLSSVILQCFHYRIGTSAFASWCSRNCELKLFLVTHIQCLW